MMPAAGDLLVTRGRHCLNPGTPQRMQDAETFEWRPRMKHGARNHRPAEVTANKRGAVM
jgi:hypothetical protein